MSTTQAKIAAKKLTESTGVPDDLAEKMYHAEEAHYVAIVDLGWLDATHGLSEKKTVRLQITQLEVLTGPAAEHARELMRATYLDRQPRGLDQVDEDDADEIIRRGRNALLLCPVCTHDKADDTINHHPDPDADGAWCTWKSDGTEVHPDQADPGSTESEPADTDAEDHREAADLTGAIPVGADA